MIVHRLATRLLSAAVLVPMATCSPAVPTPSRARLSVTSILGGEVGDFARAERPRPFVFPRDHAEHADFRNEWWYLTGQLTDDDGDDFGYQLTFFRTALAAASLPRQSAWGARNLYMGHFALSDVASQEFHFAERFARGALGLAGTTAEPFSVWLESWRLDAASPAADTSSLELPELRLQAAEEGFAVDLRLQPMKPVVAQGDNGLSRKGASPGNASHYYSVTRLRTTGVVRIGATSHAVAGASWFDREWSTSALETDQVGWDWFSLQLSDDRELMLYLMRRADGTNDPVSSGTLVHRDGSSVHLRRSDFDVQVVDRWRSREDVSYPSRWRIRVPSIALELDVEPRLADQEFAATFRYWEGMVSASGTAAGRAVRAHGFVEMTGYPES